jgi:amino acid adenylation domain-containing protein
MTNLSGRRSALSVAKRRLLEERLRGALKVPAEDRCIHKRPNNDLIPLSFAQQRLWFLDQLMPNNSFYNLSSWVRLKGKLDLEAMERSVNEIIRRHEALRTRIEVKEGGPVQVVDEWERRKLEVIDLTTWPAEEREEEVKRIAKQEAGTGFVLSRGPLLRVKVLKLKEDDLVLFFTMHHIVSDGWSMEILSREIGTLYRCYSAREPSTLEELPIQYADFAVWQRGWLQGEALEEKLDYWRKQLQGIEDLELPTDHPRPAVRSYRGAGRQFVVEEEVTRKLRALGRQKGVTMFMALLGGFDVLMSRYSGQQDIVVGTDTANRNRAEIEGLIGFFINQLVMRVEVRPAESCSELLARVKKTCLDAYAHQDVPFEKLVEELQPERGLSRSPLFQAKLILQNAMKEGLELGEARLQSIGSGEAQPARVDLAISITDLGRNLVGAVNYSRDLFEDETIERLLSHYVNLLGGIAEDCERAICELSLLNEEEKEQILVEWNRTERPYPQDRGAHELFAEQSERTPDQMALVCEDRYVSYRELNRRANQLAHYLQELGVSPEVVVGVCLERSVEMVVALLGVLKSGGAYLPLDPEAPIERLGYMLEDAGAVAVLTEREPEKRLPTYWGQTVLMDEEWARISQESEGEPLCGVLVDNLAYVIYTSGSTGKPKGVMVRHRSLVNYTHDICRQLGVSEKERGEGLQFATVSTITADLGNTCIFPSLVSGGCLHVLPYEVATDGARFGEYLSENPIDVLKIVPSHLSALLWTHPFGEKMLPMKYLILGGEASSYELVEQIRERGARDRGCEVINHYGPTETTVGSLTTKVNEKEEEWKRSATVPIGRPIANTKVYILDRELNPAPVGARGELYIGGRGVARGYWGRPGLTAERFIPNLFGSAGGDRLYRTGDVCRYLTNGKIEFIGRADDQVKVRGYRVELGEIRAVLDEHQWVKQSVVVAHEDERGVKRLIGYVVGEKEATAAELKRYVRERLPEYMVPEAILILDELPITANGKIDRKRLPSAKDADRQLDHEYAGRRTPVEEILVGIFEEVLKVDRVGIHDNFFEIGGHSLLATQIISRVRNTFGVEIGVGSIFEKATVEGLARGVEEAMRAGRQGEALPLARVPREGRLPLSFAQQRLWFLDQLMPNDPFYNVPRPLRLEGKLDLEALEFVINEIIRRHEVLRTRIEVVEGEPAQVIDEWQPRRLEVEDLTSLSQKEKEEEVRRIAREDAETGFDLSKGPLLRVKALKLEEDEHVVLFTMHHIVSDAWSVGILIKEVGAIYQAFSRGESSPIPELEIQYADYAVWQRNWLQGEVLERQLGYWRQQLAGLEPLELPLDYPRPAVAGYRGSSLNFELSEEVSRRVRSLSRKEGVTLFMTMLAALQTLLARYSGQEKIAVGSPIANRTRAETEALIGFFTNTLVLRADVDGMLSFQELLAQVRKVCLDAYAYQDLPFEQLVEHLQPERDLSRQPLFQVMLSFQQAPAGGQGLQGLQLRTLEIPVETSKFDLLLSIVEAEDGLGCNINYNSDLFEATTINRMIGHFKALLESVIADPESRLSELELLLPDERSQILIEWNQSFLASTPNCCIHQLIEAQVELIPEAVAVCFRDQHLSYQELDARANLIAHRLRALGIGPEKVVGVCSERSMEMLVGVLGILKSGAAYLPLDPAYPIGRLSLILEDSQVNVLVTQKNLASMFSQYDRSIVWLDENESSMPEESRMDSGVEMDWECPAYLLYTSGSTGVPKGVVMVHRALTNLIWWQLNQVRWSSPPRTLQFSSLSFDVSFQEIFSTWCGGGSLILIDEETHRDPVRLWKTLGEDAVERLFLPFVALQQLAEAAIDDVGSEVSLRRIITAGEALKLTPQIEKMLGRLTECLLENQYGPTESHVVTAYSLPQSVDQWIKKLPPIGRPIANTEIYILDGKMNPVPVGVTGDLYIGGMALARCYLNHPMQAGERFVPAPFSQRPGARLYLTGDRARYLPDGNIEFLGRRDHQVKVRGYRIDLGEIEAILSEASNVRECAATVQRDDAGNGYLVGYLACQEGEVVTASELRSFLQQRLPDYMIPSAYVYMESLPLTPSGKIDRRALPIPERKMANDGPFVGPRTAIEEIVAGIFEEVLKIERVGIDDNFFEIGGHSLLATRVISRVKNTFGVEIGVRSIFEKPTVKGLASRIEEVVGTGERDDAPPLISALRDRQKDARLPLSFAQHRLWFIDQLVPNNPFYNIQGGMILNEELNMDALERAINEIVRRHEVLRTRIEVEDAEPVQVIDEWEPRKLEVRNLTSLSLEARAAEVRRIVREEATTGFDLGQGPLLRVKVLELDEDEHMLLYTMHHIVSDGWSMEILIREVGTLYRDYNAGEQSSLGELDIQYADYAVWQREYLTGEVLDVEFRYWKQQLKDMAVMELPSDHPRPSVSSYRGSRENILINEDLSDGLKRLCQREGATLFMALMAAFKVVLMKYSGEEDVVVGTVIANRTRKEIEGLIGFFVNTLVLRTDLKGNPSFRELIGREREVALGAYAHQEVPFEKLVEEIKPDRDLSRSPLFQVMMTLQNTDQKEIGGGGLEVNEIGEETCAAKFDLTLALTVGGQGILGSLEYSLDLFESKTIRRMARHYEHVVEQVVRDANQRIREIELMCESEREQVLVRWNATEAEYPRGLSIQELFEAQVEQGPERVALVDEEQELSYRELNSRANQLAHYLRGLGVGPEVRVGICAERSIEMIVGLLGILKAGGGYLPLDPAYPRERLRLMLDDGAPLVVLAHERCLEKLPEFRGEIVCLDQDWSLMAGQSEDNLSLEVGGDILAYVVYTSGSTGIPKGVEITHRPVLRLLLNTNYINLSSRTAVLQLAPLSFDASTFEIWAPLLHGGRLVVMPPDIPTTEMIGEAIRRHQVETMWLTSSLFNAIVDEDCEQLGGVKQLLVGGEALSVAHVQRAQTFLREIELINGYGPTEGTTFTCCHRIGKLRNGERNIPIGRPIANTEVYILSEEFQPVPIGVAEELYIGGDGLARGYLGKPDLTAGRFLPHPYSAVEGARLYRTGDVARYRGGGEIEFIGRRDEQVKIRGYRIELGEIEAVLNAHQSVKQSVILLGEDERGKRLIGYVVGDDGATPGDLRRYLGERLPEFMVPDSIMILDEIPITANGKIDRHRLPRPAETRRSIGSGSVAPRDVLELKLVQIWEDVLGIHPIGVTDNFFDLGGHSLLALRLMSRIRNSVGRDLALSVLFEGGTVEGLASMLRQEISSMSWSCMVELQGSGSEPPLFFVHPAGGHVLCYLDLARGLGPDQPFYGFQAPGLYGERPVYTKIEDLAALYIDAMRAVQPEGPYCLGGWSAGGSVAYEMAQQLLAQNERVSHLLMLDCGARTYQEEHQGHVEEDEEHQEQFGDDDVSRLIESFGEALPISREELAQFQGDERIEYVIKRAMSVNLLPPDVDVRMARSFLKVYRTNTKALGKYVYQSYPGAITLFKTAAPLDDQSARIEQMTKLSHDPTLGWGDLAAGGVQVVEIPGTHETMMSKPHVETLALRIRDYLYKAKTTA